MGEPFAAHGAVKDDLTDSEIEALEAWALNEAREGGLLTEVSYLGGGAMEVRGG